MTYLILQILFCLIIAFLLGMLLGWLLCKCCGSCNSTNTGNKNTQSNVDSTISHYAPPPPPVKSTMEAVKVTPPPPPAAIKEEKVTAKAKSNKATVKDVDLSGSGYEIETLEGVGPKTGTALRDIGITTVSDFLNKANSPSQRSDIASKIAVRPKMVDSWASMSDLLRIEGVDHQAAELMHASGIKVIADLAKQNSTTFITKMEEVNTAGKRSIAPEIPAESSVNNWIAQASRMKQVVNI